MGYYTRYTLTWKAPVKTDKVNYIPACDHQVPKNARFCPECGKCVDYKLGLDDIIGERIEGNENMHFALAVDGTSAENCTWYDHDNDMKALSKEFPDVLFTLHGIGEEAGDIWVKYFRNGKVQSVKGRIVFDPFDPKKLK